MNEPSLFNKAQDSMTPSVVIPWLRGDNTRKDRMQMSAAFKENMLDHMAALDPSSDVSPHPLTKLVCGIGTTTNSVVDIETLLEAGITSISLPMWLFNDLEKVTTIRSIREAVNNFSVKHDRVFPLAVGIDLRGPLIHTGRLVDNIPVKVEIGTTLCLTTNESWRDCGTSSKVYIDCPDLPDQLKSGVEISVEGGKIILCVSSIEDTDIHCNVVKGNLLYNNRIVMVLGSHLALKELTNTDLEDIEFAINMELDFIILPTVRFDCILKELRRLLDFRQSAILLLAKIENLLGVANIDSICKEADAIVLVRDSMSVEATEERLFMVQDNVTAACKRVGKPFLVEGNLMRLKSHDGKNSSELNVMDIMSSIQKGVDGFLLRDAVIICNDKKQVIETLVRHCALAEPSYWHSHFFNKLATMAQPPIDPAHAISIAVVEAAMKAGASAILVCTSSGYSVKLICRYLPRVPVIAITRYGRVARQLQLFKAAVPYHYIAPVVKDWTKDIDLRFQAAIGYGKLKGIIKPGDALVLLCGWRPGAGFTNTMRMTYASQTDPWINMKDLGLTLPNKNCPDQIYCPYESL